MSTSPSIALLTGAGISTGAGIPDFRGPQGLWTKDPDAEKTSDIEWHLRSADIRKKSWQRRAEADIWAAKPTPAHLAITELAEQGRLAGVITQNTDGLHQAAGTDPALVHELHGTQRSARCQECGDVTESKSLFERVRAEGAQDFRCEKCGGFLRPNVVLFGEGLDMDVFDQAARVANECDVMIAVGSTLTVMPAANFFPLATQTGADGYIVNAQPTPYDELATEVLSGDIQEELPALLARV